MPFNIYDSNEENKPKKGNTSIVAGKVTNNCDLIMQGKVLVRIPAIDQEVWARLASIGAGSGAGFFYVPRTNDEVLVALNDNEPADAFIIGGLWNTEDTPPVDTPVDVMSKRVIKSGIEAGVGHSIEFDDGVGQSITILTTTKQKIELSPTSIEISGTGSVVKISLTTTPPEISIESDGAISLSAELGLTLSAPEITIGDSDTETVVIQGQMVFIN